MAEIIKFADLSKIHFTLDELKDMEKDMESIIHLMESIKDVDLPAETAAAESTSLQGLRADTPTESPIGFQPPGGFVIPRIIE